MATTIWLTITLFFGLAIGSFLNVLIIRNEAGEPPTGRSRCRHCGKALSVKELIPIVSFILQKGRCLHCSTALSWQYPIVEAGTTLAFGITAWLLFSHLSFDVPSFLLLAAVLLSVSATIVITVSDFRFQLIPNGAVLILFLAGTAATLFRGAPSTHADFIFWDIPSFLRDVVAAAGATATLFLFWFFSKGKWMGFGDVKLIGATSLLVGYPASIAAFLFSFWTGGLYGILLLAMRHATKKSKIPFGPFILIGTALAYFLAKPLLHDLLKFPYL